MHNPVQPFEMMRCHFCNGSSVVIADNLSPARDYPQEDLWWARCLDCKATGPHKSSPSLAEEAWSPLFLMVYDTKELNELALHVHEANIKWWQDPATGKPIERNKFELLALVISELSECLEGERKDIMDDKLPHRKMAEVELADAKIRLLDFAAGFKLDLYHTVVREKIPDNKGEALFNLMRAITLLYLPGSRMISVVIAWIDAYAAKHGYDIYGAFSEKMEYNATREDHKHEARLIAGGKQF